MNISKHIFHILFVGLLLTRTGTTVGYNVYEYIRSNNTTQQANPSIQQALSNYHSVASYQPSMRPYCVNKHEVNIRMYMYHYIRPEHRDPAHTVVWNNSITPTHFDLQMEYLADLVAQEKTHVAFLSELQERDSHNCFPHTHITILTADDGRRDNYKYLEPLVRKHNLKANLGIIYDKIGRNGEIIDPFTTYSQIKEMIDRGHIEIQSHSMSHADLRTISFENQSKEICHSKRYLESLFNIDINTFIAPYGGITAHTAYIADYCGYEYVLTTEEGVVQGTELDTTPLHLQRLRVSKGMTPEQIFGK